MPITDKSLYYRKVLNEEAFIASDLKDVASGNTYNMHLKNPSTSNKTLWVFEIVISSTGPYTATVHDTFSSAPSGGNSVTIQNLLLDSDNGSPDDGIADANTDVSFTSSDSHAVGVGGGSEGGTSIGAARNHSDFAMEPGREVVAEVTNTNSSNNYYAISIVYAEMPEGQ